MNSEMNHHAEVNQTPAPRPRSGPRVLYVDDNPANVNLIRAVLSFRPGIELISAPTGDEGLTLARGERPDLVLLDLNLPDMQGDEVLGYLLRDPATATIPTVVVSAENDGRVARRLIDRGATAYITKPFEVQVLLDTLDQLLEES